MKTESRPSNGSSNERRRPSRVLTALAAGTLAFTAACAPSDDIDCKPAATVFVGLPDKDGDPIRTLDQVVDISDPADEHGNRRFDRDAVAAAVDEANVGVDVGHLQLGQALRTVDCEPKQ